MQLWKIDKKIGVFENYYFSKPQSPFQLKFAQSTSQKKTFNFWKYNLHKNVNEKETELSCQIVPWQSWMTKFHILYVLELKIVLNIQ